MTKVRAQIDRLTQTLVPTVIEGEPGTGKRSVAKVIHDTTPFGEGAFIIVDCNGLSESQLEERLFCGPAGNGLGLLETLDLGTILFEEIASLSGWTQSRLAQTIEHEFWSSELAGASRHTQVHLLVATSMSLSDAAREGRFRKELLHRLNMARISLPPLRERSEGDLRLIIDEILEKIVSELDLKMPALRDDAVEALLGHSWPGNLRQLKSVLAKAALFSLGEPIAHDDLDLPEQL